MHVLFLFRFSIWKSLPKKKKRKKKKERKTLASSDLDIHFFNFWKNYNEVLFLFFYDKKSIYLNCFNAHSYFSCSQSSCNLYLLGLRLSTNYLFKIPLLAFAMTFFIITTVTNNMNKSNGVVKLGHMVNYCPAIFILGPNLELVVQLGKLLDIETYLHVK